MPRFSKRANLLKDLEPSPSTV